RGSDEGERALAVAEATPFERPRERGWHIELASQDEIERLGRLLEDAPGGTPIVLHWNGRAERLPNGLADDAAIPPALAEIFGGARVRLAPI
ncbi:MAG: hypothetical protein ACREM2_08725, partial [Vulcanimicrobiaceae bacterium]